MGVVRAGRVGDSVIQQIQSLGTQFVCTPRDSVHLQSLAVYRAVVIYPLFVLSSSVLVHFRPCT